MGDTKSYIEVDRACGSALEELLVLVRPLLEVFDDGDRWDGAVAVNRGGGRWLG